MKLLDRGFAEQVDPDILGERLVPAGLPDHPPTGERILWQGGPRTISLAVRAFHLRKVALYFAFLGVWRAAELLWDGQPMIEALGQGARTLPAAAAALALIVFLAWLSARSTIYTLTTKRIAIRSGVALTLTLNLPLRTIAGAGLRAYSDGTADIPLRLNDGERIGYFVLWPNVRPRHFRHPQPMLRGIRDPDRVAALLSDALEASASDRSTASRAAIRSPLPTSAAAAAGPLAMARQTANAV